VRFRLPPLIVVGDDPSFFGVSVIDFTGSSDDLTSDARVEGSDGELKKLPLLDSLS